MSQDCPPAVLLAALAIVAAAPSCSEREAESVKRVLDAAASAHGEAVVEHLRTGIRSCRIQWLARREALTVNELAHYPNRWLRHDVVRPDGEVTTKVLLGTGGFVSDGETRSELSPVDARWLATRRRENDALDVFELRRVAEELRYLGRGEIRGDIVETLERTTTGPQGDVRSRYSFSADSGLLVKRESRAVSADDVKLVEQYLTDYRGASGIAVPRRITTFLNGEPYTEEEVSAVSFNEDVDAGYFER